MRQGLRSLAGIGLTLIAAGVIYAGIPFGAGVLLWFTLALGIGLAVGRWWAILLAAVPWPLGFGTGLLTGRYLYLGDGWQVLVPMIILVGWFGIGAGLYMSWLRRP